MTVLTVNVVLAALLNETSVTPATTMALPTANGCAAVLTSVTTLPARVTELMLTASLRGVVVSSAAAAGRVLFAKFVHVSSPSVRRIVMYGRHCVAQQQFAPLQAPVASHVDGFGLQ